MKNNQILTFFSVFLSLRSLANAQSCSSEYSPAELAATTVWQRNENGSDVFRLSDEDLVDQSFNRSSADRTSFIVLLARDIGNCPLGTCAMRLSANQRNEDGMILHQENVFGVPEGFTDLHDDFYCVRQPGDCGADIPIYRFSKGNADSRDFAYSLDPLASLPNYRRDANVICYGWADGGSVLHAPDESQCLPLRTIANAKIKYSTLGAGGHSIGTTATLICNPGYAAGGQSTGLCTKHGWYPASGLGYCIRQNASSAAYVVSSSALSLAASGEGPQCAAPAPVPHGQLIYSQLGIAGRFPSSTTSTLVCDLGWIVAGEPQVRCIEGKWTPYTMPSCVPAASVICPPLISPPNAKVHYEGRSMNPYGEGATAVLDCDIGFSVQGESNVTCTNGSWTPENLGSCLPTNRRVKRQGLGGSGLGCSALVIPNGYATYIQTNPSLPYSAGSSAFIMCDVGYTLQGGLSALCQNGAWSPTPGVCTQAGNSILTPDTGLSTVHSGQAGTPCAALPKPLNGIVTYSTLPSGLGATYTSGTVGTLTCDLGSTVSGSLSSTCTNGIWSPAVLGTCSGLGTGNGLGNGLGTGGVDCPNLSVLNGQVVYAPNNIFSTTQTSGTKATLTCNLGFTVSGGLSSSCQSGVWSPPIGTCTSSGVTGGAIGSTGTSCIFGPMSPLGATVTYSNMASFGPYPSGTVATAVCSGGLMTGSSTVSCVSGQWSPATFGTCNASGTGGIGGLGCAPLADPIGGSITFSAGQNLLTYPSGSTATLVCTGGIPTGSAVSTCQSSQWSPVIGTCPPSTGGIGLPGVGGVVGGAQCFFGPIPPLGATLVYSTGSSVGPFNAGTTATAQCPTGQVVQGTPITSCQGGTWSPALGLSCSLNSAGTPLIG